MDVSDYYRRPSYGDDRRSHYEPNYLRQAYVDRRKSFHDITSSHEDRCLSPSNNNTYERYGTNGGGYSSSNTYFNIVPQSNLSRYEEEVYSAFYPNSNYASNDQV